MHFGDRIIPARDADRVRLHQHFGMGEAVRRLEAVVGKFDQEAERILDIDRVHESAVFHPAELDPALVQPRQRL
jgi:hypothetical protein